MPARAASLLLVLLLAIAAAATARPAAAANWLELNFGLSGPRYDATVPLCDNPGVLGRITSRFSHKEGEYWNSALQIVAFEHLRETAFRPWAHDAIPRRFCSGKVLVSDGVRRTVYYSIIEDTGWIGATWGVEWCVVGLDRNWAYNPSCKMARP
jgi:hypothetical protein